MDRFDSIEDLSRFLDLAVSFDDTPDSLYSRVNWQRFDHVPDRSWDFQFNLVDILQGREEQENNGTCWFVATIGVYFPQSDIETLTQRLVDLAGDVPAQTVGSFGEAE
ncbi:MAG: hypothetical protein WBH28_01370 [Fuerstiella sp.]